MHLVQAYNSASNVYCNPAIAEASHLQQHCNTGAISRRGKSYSLPLPIIIAKETLATKVRDLPTNAKLLLIELVSFAKVRNLAEPVFPAIATLAKRLNVSENTVQRHLKTLVDQDYIARTPQKHRKHGGFAVIHTILQRRVADLVGLPYQPNSFGQRSLWPVAVQDNSYSPDYIEDLPDTTGTQQQWPMHPHKPVPHSQFVAVQKDGAQASIPEDLVFLMDKGAHPYQICNWMARARKTAHQLSDLVRMRKERIINAINPVGYLVSLLKAAERGDKIQEFGKPADESRMPNGRERADQVTRREYLIKQYRGQTYHNPKEKYWVESDAQGDVLIFDVVRSSPDSIPRNRKMSVEWMHENIQSGELQPWKKTLPEPGYSPGEDVIGHLANSLRSALFKPKGKPS